MAYLEEKYPRWRLDRGAGSVWQHSSLPPPVTQSLFSDPAAPADGERTGAGASARPTLYQKVSLQDLLTSQTYPYPQLSSLGNGLRMRVLGH